jgi:Zn-dependent peptidase ImmA (M78 family)
VKRISDKTGRFAYRPFYDGGELDTLCEAVVVDYMADHSGGLTFPIPTDRLTSLIERDAAELDLYADLSAEGDDVQGLTVFKPGEKPVVFIAASVNTGGREHRFRTTLAHEYGHVLLHNNPFQEKVATGSLFAVADNDTAKCKRDSIVGAALTDWIEWQAGYVCGALLMPKSHVLATVSAYCDRYRCHDRIIAGTGYPDQVAEHISREFQVSQEAARVRITQLGVIRTRTDNLAML